MNKSILLYTQPNCYYCDIMKNMLDGTGYTYYTINIKEDSKALDFIKAEGHKTVPQLYVGDTHINKKVNTVEYTTEELAELIYNAMEDNWPWKDSGVEQGV